MTQTGSIYYHVPCFDGIVSAILAWDFHESRLGWDAVELHPLRYNFRVKWLSSHLKTPSAVVDFMFHPEAQFWADHHSTSFYATEVKKVFEQASNSLWIFDEAATSCAKLLWDKFSVNFNHRNSKYSDLVSWADKIDSARYMSVEEAITSTKPALQISATLALTANVAYYNLLVSALKEHSLETVLELPVVSKMLKRFKHLSENGLGLVEHAISLTESGIAVFDVTLKDAMVNRYSPFYFIPKARYSVGLIRYSGRAKLTAMRNPWLEFESVHIGNICGSLGGGGHQRVGSILIPPEKVSTASDILSKVVVAIEKEERLQK